MPRTPHSFFSVKTQFENAGDALINRELVRLAAESGPVTVDHSRCPPAFRRTLGLGEIPGVRVVDGGAALVLALARAMLRGETPFYFLTPGGYVGEVGVGGALGKTAALLLQAAFALAGVRLRQVGVSYERIGPRHAFFLRLRSKLVGRHLARDEISLAYARRLGQRVDGLLPDLAFNLFVAPPAPRRPVRRVALSFRVDQFPGQAEEIDRLLAALPGLLDGLVAPDATFVTVAQVARDAAPARGFARTLAASCGREVETVDLHDDIGALEAFYRDCDAIVSNRLHALLLGGRPSGRLVACVSGGENAKIEGLFESLGAADRLLRLDAPPGAAARAALEAGLGGVFDGRAQRRALVEGFRALFEAPAAAAATPRRA